MKKTSNQSTFIKERDVEKYEASGGAYTVKGSRSPQRTNGNGWSDSVEEKFRDPGTGNGQKRLAREEGGSP